MITPLIFDMAALWASVQATGPIWCQCRAFWFLPGPRGGVNSFGSLIRGLA